MDKIKRGSEKTVFSIPFTKYVLKVYKSNSEQLLNEKAVYKTLRKINIVPKTRFFLNFSIQEECILLKTSEEEIVNSGCENVLEYLIRNSYYLVDLDAFFKSFRFLYKEEILYSLDNIGILNNKVVIIDFGM